MATRPITQSERDQLIADEFGVNADYVGELLQQFERDPSSVDDQWRSLFDELLRNGRVVTERDTRAAPEDRTCPSDGRASMLRASFKRPTIGAARQQRRRPRRRLHFNHRPHAEPDVERIPIRGPALRIAENMEASLAVPTATSQRQIPLKLLDENRRLINQHVAASGRKVSYTHIIARAILKALERFPQLNDSYEESDESAFRVRHTAVNFGVAVDVTKKDGTRTLLVPNIKDADKLTFRSFSTPMTTSSSALARASFSSQTFKARPSA